MAPDEQVTMLEQLRHALLQPLDPPYAGFVLLAWPATRLFGDLGLPFLAEFGQRPQHRLGDLLEDVKLTNLVRCVRPQLLEHLGVKRRAVCSDAAHAPTTLIQLS